MAKLVLYNITWNAEDDIIEKNNLPSKVVIENPTIEQLGTNTEEYDEDLADYVSDMYGGFPIYEYLAAIVEDFTDELKAEFCQLIKDGKICTDSGVEDFCDKHNLSRREVFHWLSVLNAPEPCQGCKNIDMYPNMPPCAHCKRAYTTDYFEKEEG